MFNRFYHDHEFLEDGRTIETISVGIVAPDGAEYYAVNLDAPWGRIRMHDWLMANVMPHLPGAYVDSDGNWRPDFEHSIFKPQGQIADELVDWFTEHAVPTDLDPEIELNGWYSAYDHVSLMRFWGPMMDKPRALPMYTRDLKQEFRRLERVTGISPVKPPEGDDEHHALADARWNRKMDLALIDHERKYA